MTCSKGTYIRTLVEDIGKALGLPAYTRELRRVMIGNYDVNTAIPFADLSAESIYENLQCQFSLT